MSNIWENGVGRTPKLDGRGIFADLNSFKSKIFQDSLKKLSFSLFLFLILFISVISLFSNDAVASTATLYSPITSATRYNSSLNTVTIPTVRSSMQLTYGTHKFPGKNGSIN